MSNLSQTEVFFVNDEVALEAHGEGLLCKRQEAIKLIVHAICLLNDEKPPSDEDLERIITANFLPVLRWTGAPPMSTRAVLGHLVGGEAK